jgi:hypothetical protein
MQIMVFVLAIVVVKSSLFAYRAPKVEGVERFTKVAMQILLSLSLVGASLFIVLSAKYTLQDRHWAFGTLGTVLGFWLRGSK